MDERRADILKQSNQILSRLHLLAVFFDREIIFQLYLRTGIIHELFANDEELDINKLEIFHLQFTNSFIDLLKKIKSSNEKNVNLLYNEIELNSQLAERLQGGAFTYATFAEDRKKQTVKMSTSLRRLYSTFADDTTVFPYTSNINDFSIHYANDFFHEVNPDLFQQLIQYNPSEVYVNTFAVIHKRLLGQLHKTDFAIDFYCGLSAGNLSAEIYKFANDTIYFTFYAHRNYILFCDINLLKNVNLSDPSSEKERLIRDLHYKNDKLESTVKSVKSFIPPDIEKLLLECYLKISDIDFMNAMTNIDVQANILRTMLRTDFN